MSRLQGGVQEFEERLDEQVHGRRLMSRGWRVLIVFVVVGVIVWLESPAFQGYHVGSCNSTDHNVASTWAAQNVGPGTPGRAMTINRLFAWCKADENASDYPSNVQSAPGP